MREFLEEHNYISSNNLGGGTTLRLGLPTGSTSLGADSGGASINTSAGSSRVSSCGSISHFWARLWWSISMHLGLSLQESHVSTRQYPEHNSCLDVILQAPDIISWWHLKITHLPTGLSTVLSTVAKRPKLDHWSTCRVQMSPSVGEQKCPAGHPQQVKSWHPPPGVSNISQQSSVSGRWPLLFEAFSSSVLRVSTSVLWLAIPMKISASSPSRVTCLSAAVGFLSSSLLIVLC